VRFRFAFIAVLLLVVAAATLALVLARSRPGNDVPSAPAPKPPLVENNPFRVQLRDLKAGSNFLGPPSDPVVEKFCSTCHVLPPADIEPRALWPAKIKEMYGYAESERPWLQTQIPAIEVATDYWTSRAPDALTLPPDTTGSPPSPVHFERHMVELAGIPSPPAVSCVRFVRLADDAPIQVLISDMRHGVVVLWTPSRPTEPTKVIGRILHPSRTCVVDLDGDGILDILVANLGEFLPLDTDQGSVVWLRGRGGDEFEQIVLLDKISRVNEVSAADFDGDGDLDIVAAVFGNFTTGMIVYLENFTEDYAHPDFEPISLDGHTGTSDVPVADLNGDGRPDFIALQSQEHERIVAFLNARRGRFKAVQLYAAPFTRWGSTGIKLADLDADGDVDILFNHGDSVQVPPVLRPYHGVSWLANEGDLKFTYRRLTHLPGAHTSQPADLDGDGDLDIVSSVFIPALDPTWSDAQFVETIVWLSQTASRQFQRFRLENGYAKHPCLDVGDLDGDGDLDIVLGNFVFFDRTEDVPTSSLTVLVNQTRRSSPGTSVIGRRAQPPAESVTGDEG
jgi:hypothetical protein